MKKNFWVDFSFWALMAFLFFVIFKNSKKQEDFLKKQEDFFENEKQNLEREKEQTAKKSLRNKYLNILGIILTLIAGYYSHNFFFDQYDRIISERDWFYAIYIESYNSNQVMDLNYSLLVELSKYETQDQINDFIKRQNIYFIRNKAMEAKHDAIKERYSFTSAEMISHKITNDSIHKNNILEYLDTLK